MHQYTGAQKNRPVWANRKLQGVVEAWQVQGIPDINLEDVNLEDGDLEDVNLEGVDLEDRDLEDVDLEGVDLEDIDLEDVDLEDVDLEDVNLEERQESVHPGPTTARCSSQRKGPQFVMVQAVPWPVAPAPVVITFGKCQFSGPSLEPETGWSPALQTLWSPSVVPMLLKCKNLCFRWTEWCWRALSEGRQDLGYDQLWSPHVPTPLTLTLTQSCMWWCWPSMFYHERKRPCLQYNPNLTSPFFFSPFLNLSTKLLKWIQK